MPSAPAKSGYAPVNGLHLYYEIHGSGQPVILLHGGLGSTEMFTDLLPPFSRSRQAILVDLQAHGRTADIDRPIRYETMADDMAALLKHLQIARADFLGYSLGAGVALQTAIRHPAVVGKLVVISTGFKRQGWYPEILAAMAQIGPAAAEQMKPSPIYQTYARVAPRPEDWPKLVMKVGELVRTEYDWSREVAAIEAATMLVFGDADAMPPAHIAEFFGLLGGGKKDGGWDGSGITKSRLAILPGVTHYNMLQSPLLPQAVGPFLEISGG